VAHLADADALQDVIVNKTGGYVGVFDERTSILFRHRRRPVIELLSVGALSARGP